MKTEHEKEQRRQQKRRARERKAASKPPPAPPKINDGHRLVRGELWATVGEPPMLTTENKERAKERHRHWRKTNPDKANNATKAWKAAWAARDPVASALARKEKQRRKTARNHAAGLTSLGKVPAPRPAKREPAPKKPRAAPMTAEQRKASMINRRRLKLYGITTAQWEELFAKQEGKCAICHDKAPLVADHCHKVGRMRELLCSHCNTAEGMLRSDPARARAALAYIEKWHIRPAKRRAPMHPQMG